MYRTGPIVVVAVVALAVALAGAAVWIQHNSADEAMTFWGENAAAVVRDPQVQAFLLGPTDAESATLESAEPLLGHVSTPSSLRIEDRKVLAAPGEQAARGLTHIRRGLLTDEAFDWSTEQVAEQRPWKYALKFGADEQAAYVIFDSECEYIANPVTGREVSAAATKKAFREFLREQFPAVAD